MPFVEKFLVVWRETSKGKTFFKGGQESTMQHYSMEKIRESFELVVRGGIIATFVLLMFRKPLSSLEQYLLDVLPEVSMEGTMEKPKQQKQEKTGEVVPKKFMSIHQEDMLRAKEEEEKKKEIVEAVIYLESGTKQKNQIGTAEVIRNRTKDPKFPNDVIEVCNQDGQFQTIQDGVPVDQKGNPIDLEIVPEMEAVYQKVFVEESNETEKLLKAEAFRQGLYSEKYWKGGALYFSNLDGVSEEVYAKGRYDEIKVSVEIGGNTFWRYWG